MKSLRYIATALKPLWQNGLQSSKRRTEHSNEEITERKKAETEKRKIESQLAQTQRIEALDRFAGGIAHDLNNILYPILINIEELLAEAPVDSSRHELLTRP